MFLLVLSIKACLFVKLRLLSFDKNLPIVIACTCVQVLQGSAMLRPETEWTVRLCYVDFDGDRFLREFENSYAKITRGDMERLAPGMCAGLRRLKEFVVRYSSSSNSNNSSSSNRANGTGK